jgi:hypothetical protein
MYNTRQSLKPTNQTVQPHNGTHVTVPIFDIKLLRIGSVNLQFCCPDTHMSIQNDHFSICVLVFFLSVAPIEADLSGSPIALSVLQMPKQTPNYCPI